MAIDVDARHWPLVFTRFGGSQTVEEVDRYVAEMKALIGRKQPWVSVPFMEGYSRDPRVLKRIAEFMKDTDEATRLYCAGVAMVAPSAGFRFVLSSVFLIQPLACPYIVCASLEEAMAFVGPKARERGISLPAARPEWK